MSRAVVVHGCSSDCVGWLFVSFDMASARLDSTKTFSAVPFYMDLVALQLRITSMHFDVFAIVLIFLLVSILLTF